jgi:hypothetical protein
MDEDELRRIEAAVERCDDWLSEGTGDHFAEAFRVRDLVAEVRQLRGLLEPLVARTPFGVDTSGRARCGYCNRGEGERATLIHFEGCPWAAASKALFMKKAIAAARESAHGGPMPGMVTLTEEADGGWAVLIDPPWKAHGLHVGTFRTFEQAARYATGRP